MHKKVFILRLIIMLALLPLFAHAESRQTQIKGDFTMKYAQFIHAFQSKNWAQLTKYETKGTKCGFGPGEEGVGCIERRFASNERCIEEMLFSLKQGCKVTTNDSNMSCTSPPQWVEDSIIILGARASFTYDVKSKSIYVNHFICGGD